MNQESQLAPYFIYSVICKDNLGNEKWSEEVKNLVTTVGKTDIVDKYFKASAYTAAWYLGLKGSGTISSSDTLASHSGWSEITPYSGNRPAITFGTTASGSNTTNALNISINATSTISGAFLANASSGTSGILYSTSDFTVARTVASGDTLSVTLTLSVS